MASPAAEGGGTAHLLTLTPSQQQARASYEAWEKFFNRALEKRLDMDQFADWAPIMKERHAAVGPIPLADLVLRPTRWNKWTLDPRVPYYLQTLLDLHMVDVPAVLAALYRYSTAHALLLGERGAKNQQQQQNGDAKEENGSGIVIKSEGGIGNESKNGTGGLDKSNKQKEEIVRWQSSFSSEEVIFYRLTKAVAQGAAIKNGKDAVEICAVMARWMTLFTTASATFAAHDEDVIMGGAGAGDSPSRQKRDEMENVRAAFVMLLLGVCENPIVLQALGKDYAKRKSCRFTT